MVPLLIGVGTVRLVSDVWKADEYNREARHVNYEAFSMVESASRKFQSQREKLDETLTKLANRKRGIISGSLTKFVNVYERIKRIDFDEMHSVDAEKSLALRDENLSAINQMISVSGVQMSTEQTLGTFLFSWEYGGIGGAIKKEARINLDVAYTRSDEAEVIAHQTDTARLAVEGITDKAESVLKLLTMMNALFLKSLQYTSEIIDQRGSNKRNYGVDDKKALMNCMNFAKALSDVLKAPLFDSNGKLSRQIDETLTTGNEYIKKIQAVR
ncbi:MAG: hypothetical protein IJ685_07605 [Selenomonadaceae bacterium]|nr:hypothetical protein [Selenomonadaceae bacterium]